MAMKVTVMPEVDRVAASRKAVEARRARAEVKRQLQEGELSPLKALDRAHIAGSPCATLRITEFLLTFPGFGEVRTQRTLEELAISPRKRLGGLGVQQRERLEAFVRARVGAQRGSVGSVKKPLLTVLAGPTAVGKGTVAAYVREHFPEIMHSVSVTTRPPRPGEVEGKHYFFIDDEQFDRMLASDDLLEWAVVHNSHRYGTPRQPIIEAGERGEQILLEIDLQGARQVRASMPEAHLVFLAPPSWDELVSRLLHRGTEGAEERERRLATAKIELAAADEFDDLIVNDTVADAASRLVEVIRGEERGSVWE